MRRGGKIVSDIDYHSPRCRNSVEVYLNKAEYDTIVEAAMKDNMSLSMWCRHAALEKAGAYETTKPAPIED